MASTRRGPSRSASGAVSGPNSPAESVYASRSQRPLEILFFLLPLVVFYEAGLVMLLRSGQSVLTNRAHDAMLRIFDAFGLDGATLSLPALSLPGALLVVILLAWQALARLPWEVDLRTVATMWIESASWAVPLLVVAQVIALAVPSPIAAAVGAGADGTETVIRSLSPMGRIAVSIGAGLYEELVFRMLLFALLHTLLVDGLKWPERRAIVIAIVVSAVAFAFYHPLRSAAGAVDFRRAIFFLVAGLYFGGVYAFRGFGIVVGTHAAYDIVAALMPE